MISTVIGIGFGGIGSLVALEQASSRRRMCRARVRAISSSSQADHDLRERALQRPIQLRLLEPTLRRMVSLALRLSSYASDDDLRHRLHRGGVTVTPHAFLVAKAALAVVGFAWATLVLAPGSVMGLAWAAALGPILFVTPDSWLTMRQRARSRTINQSLPDMLDLLTVSVEAGLAFDGAALKVTERLHGPLSDELAFMLRELRIGISRREALTNLTERCGSDEVASFTRALVQSEDLGSSLGQTLQAHASDLRQHRQIAAEEQATKAPVKMLFPTVLFIFPAIFVVTLGPAFLNIMHMFNG